MNQKDRWIKMCTPTAKSTAIMKKALSTLESIEKPSRPKKRILVRKHPSKEQVMAKALQNQQMLKSAIRSRLDSLESPTLMLHLKRDAERELRKSMETWRRAGESASDIVAMQQMVEGALKTGSVHPRNIIEFLGSVQVKGQR